MKFNIITIFPDLFSSTFSYGIIKHAVDNGLLEINIHDLRKWTCDRHKQVDDRSFGGGPGMILKPEPLFEAVESIKLKDEVTDSLQKRDKQNRTKEHGHVILLSPQGKTFNQQKAEELSKIDNIILICGRYEGVDQRVIENIVDEEISIGRYVLSGGEIPAMVVIDAVSRLIQGVIKNEDFNANESFSDPKDRDKLDFPQYTRPADYKGMKVPEVLLSGDHKKIETWRRNVDK
ncbi:tRNA (guanosine(37)-N1)-methyltransferase TrmD [candidate division WWE3 bacterium RIFCSPLOWO2_01_FULL_39_13]|uniref:tRNA (guanine-N(1)-)-methyltransferase n=1 Tax=candidate division WWE3 bacterium RIFCSPLOWO2_01_FULL_39_13 TaxID=1802624 RepID=A0A1F4V5F9_UNCKA|nr:MAG: tRNA (guanosine(37)-N1)-methyltransferase TrmD [candidate division WWE3 bacterium RIFCSPLOWO2_01_FULL_39_13]